MSPLKRRAPISFRKAIETCKRIIRIDPLHERAYQGPMAVYFCRGMRNQALRVYEDCKKALETLDTDSSELTQSLYMKIL